MIDRKEIDIKYNGFNDLYFFCKYILGYKDLTERTHRNLCDFTQKKISNLDLEPRGHFKTSIRTIGKAIFEIVNNPDIRILINHKILARAVDIMREIRGHFERNQRFRYFYGDMVGDKWGQDSFIVRTRKNILKEPTVAIGSPDHEATSGHYDVIINDDLVGLKDRYSEAERRNTMNYFKTLIYLQEPDGYTLNTGTRWHIDDLYNYMIDKKLYKDIRIRKAIKDDGQPLFPERFTVSMLEHMRKEDPEMFEAQMMNNPIPSDEQLYRYENLIFCELERMNQGMAYAYIDPAISKKSSADFTAMVIGRIEHDEIDVIDSVIGRYKPESFEFVVMDKCRQHNIQKIGIESNAFQELYIDRIDKALKGQKIWCEIEPVKHSSDKVMRINACHGHIINRVRFRKDWEQCYPLLIQQLISFPQGEHDDAPDALEGLISMFFNKTEVIFRTI